MKRQRLDCYRGPIGRVMVDKAMGMEHWKACMRRSRNAIVLIFHAHRNEYLNSKPGRKEFAE